MNRTANKILRQSTCSSLGCRLRASIAACSTCLCRPMGNPRTPRPEQLRANIALEASLSPAKPLGQCFRDVFLDRGIKTAILRIILRVRDDSLLCRGFAALRITSYQPTNLSTRRVPFSSDSKPVRCEAKPLSMLEVIFPVHWLFLSARVKH